MKCRPNGASKEFEMAVLAELTSSRTKWQDGQLLHIHLARAASFKMEELAEANFVAGRGIEGDRYFLGRFSLVPSRSGRTTTAVTSP
jgi:hypothetical protein